MAGIDYTIPGQFKGIQLESPMNQMAQAMQLRGLQEASQMNALRAQEYELKTREAQEMSRQRNALAQYLANPKKPTNPLELESGVRGVAPLLADQWVDSQLKRGELDEKIEGRKYQNFERKFRLYQSVTPNIRTIDDVSKFVAASYQDPDLGPILNQIRPYEDAINANQDAFNEDPENWRLQAAGVSAKDIAEIARTREQEKRLAGQEERAAAEARQKERDRTAPKPEKYDLGGKIVTIDMNPLSSTHNQEIRSDEKSAAPVAPTESPLAKLVREREALAGEAPNSPLLKVYDEAISKETGGAPPALVQEYLYAQKNNGFKGTLLDFKKQVAMAGRSVTNNPAPVQTVTVQGRNGPELRDARTGRLITDDKGQPLKPYDASNRPLSPAQQQKIKKDRLADDAKITSAKDMADDIEKNVDALLGNEKKKISPHPGLPGITGYNAMLPSLPGGQPRAAQQLLDSVKGKVTQVGKSLASQEGKLGNMAVQEWKIVADAVERIDPAAPNFAAQLRSVVSQARRLETNLKSRRDAAYAPDQSAGQSSIFSEADAIIGQ